MTTTVLHEIQRAVLQVTLNLIIPPSNDGRLPGAAEYDIFAYINEFAPSTLPALVVELDQLEADAQSQFGASFSALAQSEAKGIVDTQRSANAQFMAELARQTVACYYQQDRVMSAIGMQVRPPFPQGYEVHFADLTLLDPVRARGQIYRDVD